MQIVTSENFQQFVETGKVPEFKPQETKAEPDKVEPPRDAEGKFVKADVDKPIEKEDKSESAGATPEDDGDEGLSEKVRKKIGAKHRAMKEAEEFAEQQYNERKAAERRADNLFKELEEVKSKSRPNPVVEAQAKPNADDFKTVGEYAEALSEYLVEKKIQERQTAAEAQRQKDEAARVKAEFSARIAKVMKEVPDYAEVVEASDADVPPHVAQHIVESDVGPLLGYHLAKHPEELDRIRKLSPIRAIAELGKLEVKLEKKADEPAKAAATPPVEVSKAPAPIQPLDSSASTVVHKDPAKMTFQELREWDRQQRAKQRR
jgi:hypothetical protein